MQKSSDQRHNEIRAMAATFGAIMTLAHEARKAGAPFAIAASITKTDDVGNVGTKMQAMPIERVPDQDIRTIAGAYFGTPGALSMIWLSEPSVRSLYVIGWTVKQVQLGMPYAILYEQHVTDPVPGIGTGASLQSVAEEKRAGKPE